MDRIEKYVDSLSEDEAKHLLMRYRIEACRPIFDQWLDDYKLRHIEVDSLFSVNSIGQHQYVKGGDLG
jgi:hypothetical protein